MCFRVDYDCNLFVYGRVSPCMCLIFFFKQKTAYEMRISDWSSDVCSSDLAGLRLALAALRERDRTGKGQLVKSALFESTAYLMAQHMGGEAITGKEENGRASWRERVCQ